MSSEEILEQPGARWSPWVVVVIVVVLLGALGVGVWVLRRPPEGPLPPPDVPWPVTGKARIFLCADDGVYENCRKGAITAAQRLAVERSLRAIPEVSAVRYVSRAEALKNFTLDPDMNRLALQESDMPESFEADLTTMSDFQRKAETLPGVSNLYLSGTSFWAGKTDVVVRLCPREPLERDTRCRGRGAASAAEKEAVYQALRTLEGVGAIYLEDHGHAAKDIYWASFAKSPDKTKPFAYIPDSFHLVLDAPYADARVRRVVGEFPGVNTVDKELS
ncbi:permease-like cell division protein FtsX [Sphaerisporangium sp. NPDC051011]|uniref:permease-like cell division protein FtsX n=1 Tax=Sphaerisporangium sp. NPDC051011 TaxID=3155792 RepID=UPI0034011239